MANLSITLTHTGTGYEKRQSLIAAVSALNATFIYMQTGTAGEVFKVTTADGGVTWSAETGCTDPASGGTYTALCIWYSKWTPGTDRDKIYIGFGGLSPGLREFAGSLTNAGVEDDAPQLAGSPTIGSPSSGSQSEGQICMGENGNVYMFMRAQSGGVAALWRSTNDMATGMTVVWETDATDELAGENSFTRFRMIPSPINGNDMMLIAAIPNGGTNGNISYIIWDDAAQAWGSWVPIGPYSNASSTTDKMLDAQIRIVDRKVFVVYVDNPSAALQTLRCFSIDSSLQIEQLADVELGDSVDTFLQPALCIDQQTGHLYAAWIRNQSAMGNDKLIQYKRSRQSGNSWGALVEFADTAESDIEAIIVPASTPGFDETFFQPIWYDDTMDLWRTETANQVVIAGGYTVREAVDGGAAQVIVDCQSGQTSQVSAGGSGQDTVRLSKTPYPTNLSKFRADDTDVIWLPYVSKTSGTISQGDVLKGSLSRATGAVVGFRTNPTMVGLASVKNGPGPGGGASFRPNELLENQTQAGVLTTPGSLRTAQNANVLVESTDDI